MSSSTFLRILGYGALAGAVLLCLKLISLAPLALDWGRELIGAAIAVVAVLIGVGISRRDRARRGGPDDHNGGKAGERPFVIPEGGGGSLETQAPHGLPELSPREHEVLALLRTGRSNKQIARALNLSENTIKTHLGNLYGKLGVSRRTEALAVAQRLGLGADQAGPGR